MSEQEKPKNWRDQLDIRQRKEVELAQLYVGQYNHGTSGHLAYITLARLADLLDAQQGDDA